MSLAERFNRSELSRWLNSTAGRWFRVVAGVGFLALGVALGTQPLGVVAFVWGLVPLSAGSLDMCWLSMALGGPASGRRIRDLQTAA